VTNPTAFFVQFPHPGGEHRPAVDEMGWNAGKHRRKFLRAPGRYQDGDGHVREGSLAFWGEWEPPSRIERRWPAAGRLPRALHIPHWSPLPVDSFRQNTDPWVWGERMLYSNCKQTTGPDRRATSMQGLNPGSVICFGSTIDSEFCVDTIFVVASAEPWVPADHDRLQVDDAFKICTGQALTSATRDAQMRLTLYRAATLEDPVEGMFSFVPARLADRDPRFARPNVHLPGLINPASRQSTWGSRRSLRVATVRDIWASIRDQVLAQGLLLAVGLRTPPRDDEYSSQETSQRD